MDDIAIRLEHVSKKFCRYLRKSMLYGVQDIGRNLLRIGTRSDRLRKDEFWAVDDVSFDLHRGETLGLIGPNGSGKSTILKMLNGIFMPDKGKIEIKGRVGALIEVGAGFHPVLTGRENIYINGTILGMSKKEIDEKFDAIVDFADIGDFLDTPVKHYSSGMVVRLGFAVAVHTEPEVLLVDEVLAVGDLAFQGQCFNKINQLMNAGTTIVLVSHNLVTIRHYATQTLFINNGKTVFLGDSQEACEQYSLQQTQKTDSKSIIDTPTYGQHIPPAPNLKDVSFKIVDSLGNEKTKIMLGEEIEFHFSFFYSGKADSLQIGVIIYKEGLYLAGIDSLIDGLKLSVDNEPLTGILRITRLNLTSGKYTAVLAITNRGDFLFRGHGIDFSVVSRRIHAGFIDLPHEWNIRKDVEQIAAELQKGER